MAQKRIYIAVVVIMVAIGVMAGIKYATAPKPVAVNLETARSKGNPQARIQINEFIDFECPACAHGVGMLKESFDAHPGEMYVQVKYFPLTTAHRHAMQSALYSECAARQGKFWPMHELMMAQQSQWTQLISADSIFREMAKDVGINLAQLDVCLNSEEARKTINDEKAIGQSLGIQSTPTYFINGKMVVGTRSLTEELEKLFSKS